jgi:pimeloyl-ACP methyl ester carboxylesterase
VVLSNVPPSAPVDNAGAARRQPWLTQLSSLTCAKFSRPWSKTCWRDFLESLFVRRELVTDELVTRYYDLNRRPEASQFTTMTAIMREDAKVIDFLGRVRAPTLLIWGTDSKVLPPPTGELLAQRLTATRHPAHSWSSASRTIHRWRRRARSPTWRVRSSTGTLAAAPDYAMRRQRTGCHDRNCSRAHAVTAPPGP